MQHNEFDPFNDRLSRDLRNDLSEGFSLAVEKGDRTLLEATKDIYQAKNLPPPLQDYLKERIQRYTEALQTIGTTIREPLQQAVVLWNLGLFFEVHEVLEHSWYHATGKEKLVLQAMIRSAGVYVKLESGFTDPARRIAAKAISVLEEHQDFLAVYFLPTSLIEPLRDPMLPPPRLERADPAM